MKTVIDQAVKDQATEPPEQVVQQQQHLPTAAPNILPPKPKKQIKQNTQPPASNQKGQKPKKSKPSSPQKKKTKHKTTIDDAIENASNDEVSGSEYTASGQSESSDSDVSLDEDEEDSHYEDDSDDDANTKKKGSRGALATGKRKASSATTTTKTPAVKNARTPSVALNNSMSVTPATLPTAGRPSQQQRSSLSLAATTPAGGRNADIANMVQMKKDSPARAVLEDTAPPGTNDASRFSSRDAARFPFLHPDKIRDSQKRRPSDPGYDPTTIHIPPDWFKTNKISEGQRQWWDFKASHWGSVLLFKMGKFYELFEMDAHIGAECLGLSYMKGDQPHCGFPEAGYLHMAERLVKAGHRVIVIEQTETPEMLAARNEERKRQGLKKDGVVRREKVAVLTRGTLTEAEMLNGCPDAQYLMALSEIEPCDAGEMEENCDTIDICAAGGGDGSGGRYVSNDGKKVLIGAAAVDVATGHLILGQWYDDALRSKLRAALTALQPVEMVLPRRGLSSATRRVTSGVLRSPLVNELHVGDGEKDFWTAEKAITALREGDYFKAPGSHGEGSLPRPLPVVLDEMLSRPSNSTSAAWHALGGCLSYLKNALLDRRVLGAGKVGSFDDILGLNTCNIGGQGASLELCDDDAHAPLFVSLDGPALENLEILENSEGGVEGTLMAALDHCTTPFGRRRLRQWLCKPLGRIADITRRQDAVADLMGVAEDAACTARKALSGVADLERALARLGVIGAGLGSLRDSPRVILYEDVAKKRVHAFLHALKALEKVQHAIHAFSGCADDIESPLLRDLAIPVTYSGGKKGGTFPDIDTALEELRNAADWEEAESSGRVVPAPGVDPCFDTAQQAVHDAEAALEDYIEDVRAQLKTGKEVKYASLNRETHVIEVPDSLTVPRDWESMQGKKGVKRYMSAELRELVNARAAALDDKDKAQTGILQGILRKFSENQAMWSAAVDAVAQLDALMSLAVAATCGSGTMSRPTFLPWSSDAAQGEGNGEAAAPVFKARGLRHPAGIGGMGGTFVPNDVELGGSAAAPFVVLTGPNMGGKSTLMRQVCLAAVAAQIGAWVPAESLELTPADAIFVRMGARDRIMLGQSTFFVELSETAAALHRATPRSIVALDELGRGTATTDGAAIAAAVLDYLAGEVRCRGIFATHYHHISDSHAEDPAVAIKHMACSVVPAKEPGDVDEVLFLYKLTKGACPKSYGVNVARLAGLPESVVKRAAVAAEEAETHGCLDGCSEIQEHDLLENIREQVVQRALLLLKGTSGEEEMKNVWIEARKALLGLM